MLYFVGALAITLVVGVLIVFRKKIFKKRNKK